MLRINKLIDYLFIVILEKTSDKSEINFQLRA